ncbi:MAG: translocation/assembly module TamB domain-containing protein [Brumimicrobium sp.]
MAKLLKILGKSLLTIIEFLILVIILFSFFIRTTSFQTFLGKKGAEFLSNKIGAKVTIEEIGISFFDRVYLDKLYIEDEHSDTLLYVDELFVNVGDFELNKLKFDIDELGLSNSDVNLKRYKDEDDLNFQFIIDAFESDKPKSDTPPFEINVANLVVSKTDFSFEDENKETKDFGVDFSHLDLKRINLNANTIQIIPEKYKGNISKLSLKDRSGFDLNNFVTSATFDHSGLNLTNTLIKTKQSKLDLPAFDLVTERISDYQNFVDAVLLNLDLNPSKVSFYDISLFAPQLEGMDEVVTVRGKTRNVVNNLDIKDFEVNIGDNSMVAGDFHLPDFTEIDTEDINHSISKYRVYMSDVESIRMPNSADFDYVKLNKTLKILNYVSGNNLTVNGNIHDLKIDLHELQTGIGDVNFKESFSLVSDTSFSNFKATLIGKSRYPIEISNMDVGKLIASREIGIVNGKVGMKSVTFNKNEVKSNNVNGVFRKTELLEYKYDYIAVDDVDYTLNQGGVTVENSINGLIYVRDENLDMTFNGAAAFGSSLQINALIDLECAHLENIHPKLKERGELFSKLKVHGSGKDIETFNGTVEIDTLYYSEDNDHFALNKFTAEMIRTKTEDVLDIQSDVFDAHFKGKIDLKSFVDNITYQLASVFPAFFPEQSQVTDLKSKFEYRVDLKRVNSILDIFYPELQVANNTSFDGEYNGEENTFNLNVKSDYVAYDNLRMDSIYMMQDYFNKELLALYKIDGFSIDDSLAFKEIHYTGIAAEGFMDSQLILHDTKESRSNLEWYTHIFDKNGFEVEFLPSYFTLNNHKWNLNQEAHLNYMDKCFMVDDFKLERNNQYISFNGQLSDYEGDHLNVDVMNLDLEDVGLFLGAETDISGVANVVGYISNPFNDFKFSGESIVEELYINETEVGDVSFGADFDADESKIKMFGDIFYKKERTFAFKGNYSLKEEERDLLDFSMIFRKTDIAVVNEFLDPDVVSGIAGKLDGALDLKGTIAKPELTGEIKFNDGKANLAILGADFLFNGEIVSEVDGVYINTMPVMDEEGNTGFLNGSLFHDNFEDFFFELDFNLKDHPTKKDPNNNSKPYQIERFMVMKTEYSEDSPYYGTAFVTGTANISGYADNLSITVDAETEKGTKINFPMYGPTTVEEEGFISFKKPDGENENEEEDKIDFTGVDLALDFDVTPDAQVKLIFDEDIGDEIKANGEGKISMNVDQYGDLALNGTYTVTDGVYNFAMGPYKQNFNIAKGGTVRWSGDPYSAYLNIETYYKTNANIAVLMPDVLENKASQNEEIFSYLNLQGDMLNPQISFDLKAPKASEEGKAVINRVRSDQDELNKQFFALLITKGFLPLSGQDGQDGGSGSALLDLASTQINSVLGKVSENYKMNVNLENDSYSGQFSGEFGVSKGFLDDRLLVSGSFGVGSVREGDDVTQEDDVGPGQNSIIGDVEIEYLLNENGTFRVSAFNESNSNSVVQNNNRGQFTQGVGISYKEDFHNLEDFKLFQALANLFRKKENKKQIFKNEDNKEPIPKEYKEKNAVKEEE